ncbi:MAG: glycerophosphodiester phosphodiesterase [Desulfobacteraceae bacterium]|nr:glycerophosphodiester phosphodiesterase [Desulfobacteraceae bacterium]
MSPLKIAHRGAMTEAPENTRSAFDRAMDRGVDGIEFDVQITKDGIPVIYHDAFLHKITGSFTAISDYTLAQLQHFDFGRWFSKNYENEKILTLEQTLSTYGTRTRLFVEIKSSPNPQARSLYEQLPGLVVDCVKNCIPKNRIVDIHILSFDAGMLYAAFAMGPDLKYILNLEAPFSIDAPPRVNREMLYGYGLEHTRLNHPFVAQCHEDGKTVFTYSCNTVAAIERAMSLDVNGIMTDDPGGDPWGQFFQTRNQ